MRTLLSVAAFAAFCAAPAIAGTPLPYMPPATQGISPERLHRVDSFVEQAIQRNDYLGAVVLVLRNGKVVDYNAYGHRDLARSEPLQRDAIFRIYSMSKTVTAAAILMLMEEGKLLLDDPISKYLPEFAEARVFVAGTAAVPETRPPKSPITIRQLLTHTPGFASYGDRSLPVNQIFDSALLPQASDLDVFSKRLARVPLAHEPGAEFHYDGTATVVAGRIVEVVSGLRFDAFLHKRLFRPLQMADTGFIVPPAKRGRIVDMTTTDAGGRLSAIEPGRIAPAGELQNPYFSGGGGLYSTAGDYARFAQMLLNKGELGGVRILSPEAVALMTANHISPEVQGGGYGVGLQQIRPGYGMAFNGAVFNDPPAAGSKVGVGTYQWDGAAGTWFWIDPTHDLLYVGLIQRMAEEGAQHVQAITQALIAEAMA